jgi:uncharacterized protein
MEKKYFALYLRPSRPDFAQTMSDEERAIMNSHVGYWMELMKKGNVVAFGPVADPKGFYGLGIISAENEEEVQHFIAGDPAGKINRYEYYPMNAIVAEK